jgi:hypothetical protein
LVCLFSLIGTFSLAFGKQPARSVENIPQLFRVTTAETRPGDAVLIRGEYLDKLTGIKVCRLNDDPADRELPGYVPLPREDAPVDVNGTDRKAAALMSGQAISVELLQQNTQSVKFIVPETLSEGVFSVQLVGAENKPVAGFYLNAPQVIWAISEEGLKATVGEYLRIQGKNLLREGMSGQVVLVSIDGRTVARTKIDKAFDDYSVSVTIPGNIPAGVYHLYYHNGRGGKTAWSEPLKIEVVTPSANMYDKKIFDVKDFGARGDGVHNETAAFREALDAAEKNGGGTVYVPRGRYMLTGGLILGPNTMLKGESKELTHIFWNPLNWDINELPASLISGTHHFAVKDMVLWATRAWGIIMQHGPVSEHHDVTLENLIVRQSAQIGGMVYQQKANRDKVEAELQSRWNKTGIVLRGENLKVRNCDFNSAGMYTFFAVSGFIQHCTFARRGTGVNQPYMAVHPKGLIFEDCYKQGDGFGYAATIDESRNLYEARNVIPFNYTNDREVMTFDGGSGGYAGNIKSVSGKAITLPDGANTYQWFPDKWIGGGLYIISGKGAGQFRRIANHTVSTIELDYPFLVEPDTASIISITTVRTNLFFINNAYDDGGAYQFYGSAQNCVISGLKTRRTSGIISRGSLLYHGNQPNWYIDIVNCELREGNYSHWFGIDDRGHSGAQRINLIGTGGAGMNIGTLVRRNTLSEYSYIQTSPGANPGAVTDVIIEDNSFTIAKEAIRLGGSASHTSNVLIHNNHYHDVEKQVDTGGLNPSGCLILNDDTITNK